MTSYQPLSDTPSSDGEIYTGTLPTTAQRLHQIGGLKSCQKANVYYT